MKRKVLIITIVLFVLTVAFASCSDKGIGDGELPMDSVVYSSSTVSKDYMYAMFNNKLGYFNVYDAENKYNACSDPLCDHSSTDCSAYLERAIQVLIVEPEKRSMPLIYIFGYQDSMLYKDGEIIKNPDGMLMRIVELDMSTGERRDVVPKLPFENINGRLYYNGKLYMSAHYLDRGGVIATADVATGEYRELDYDVSSEVIGIYDDWLYFITYKGLILRCDLELKNYEEVYDCGMGYIRPGNIAPVVRIQGSKLYYETNCRNVDEPECFTSDTIVSDIYMIDLSEKTISSKLIIEGARSFYLYDDDVYYTLWDYEYYGKFDTTAMGTDIDIYSTTGGNLYKYDTESGKSELFIEDAGADFENIYEMNDKYILFAGFHYDDIPTLTQGDLYKYGFATLSMYRYDTQSYEIIIESLFDDIALK